jgi:sugar-specific transcriptional regulator TrmB
MANPRGSGGVTRKRTVKWKDGNWLALARTLHSRHPELDLLNKANHPMLPGLTTRHLNDAVPIAFPDPDLHRHFNWVDLARPSLSIALDTLRDHPELLLQDANLETDSINQKTGFQIEDDTLPIIREAPGAQEPVARPQDPTKAVASAMHTAFKKHGRAREWDSEDWVEVARTIHVKNPHANYPFTELAGLRLDEIRDAQRILPQDKRRKLFSAAALREPLKKAFKVIRKEIELHREEERLQQQARELETRREELEVIAATPAPPTPQEAAQQNLTAALLQAFSPFFQACAQELSKHLASSMKEAMLEALTDPDLRLPTMTAAAAQPEKKSKKPEPTAEELKEREERSEGYEQQPRPPKIGIIGPDRQRQYLESAFPELDFVFCDRHDTIRAAMTNCTKIIGLESHVIEGARSMLKKGDKSKISILSGGPSAIKRQIELFLRDGQIKPLHAGQLLKQA